MADRASANDVHGLPKLVERIFFSVWGGYYNIINYKISVYTVKQ